MTTIPCKVDKLAWLSSALLIAACGSSSLTADAGGDGGGGAGAVNVTPDLGMQFCGDPNMAIDPTAAIDDMEDRDFVILNRSGAWWAGGDTTPGGSIVPSGNAAPEPIAGGRCGSQYASHVTGHGFNDWGAVLSMSFRYGSPGDGGADEILPYDAHFRQGLTFWARIGDTSTNQVRLALSDKYSRPEGGICVVDGGQGTGCYDTFGVQLTKLDTSWHEYRIPFGGLSQRMFGIPEPALDTSTLFTIEFAFAGGAVFDFWIDDISFY
jgi:hypothetical protein